MAVVCKDEGGQLVTWRGPKGPLRANTQPSVQDTSIGKLLKFNTSKLEQAGNYTCSLSNNIDVKKIFSLIVADRNRMKVQYPDFNRAFTYSPRLNPYDTNREATTEDKNRMKVQYPDFNRAFTYSPRLNSYDTNRDTTTEDTKFDPSEIENETDKDTEKETDSETDSETESETEPNYYKPKLNTRRPIYKDRNRVQIQYPDFDPPFTDSPRFNPYDTNSETTTEEDVLFKDTPEEQRAVENKEVLLRCEVSGDAKISWKVEDEENLGPRYKILGDGLLITEVSRADSNKIFNCQASQTSTGKFLSKKIKLIVEHKPEPVYEEYKKVVEIYGFIGEYVNLTCSVMAEPAPRFSWEKKTGKIFKVGTHVSILQIHMTERAAGTYQCTASNQHGELVTIFNVLIGKKPEPPTNVELMNYTKDSLTISVELPIVPQEDVEEGMEPKWLVVQYRINGTEDWSFREFNISQDYAIEDSEDAITIEDATTTEEPIYELEEVLYLSDLRKTTTYEVIAATKNIASLSDYTNSTFFTTSKSANVKTNSFLGVILVNLMILFVSTPA